MSALNKIPANGYSLTNELRFELNGYIQPKPIDIHSCFNQFIINPRLVDEYISASNKEETELYTTFDIQTLKGFTQDLVQYKNHFNLIHFSSIDIVLSLSLIDLTVRKARFQKKSSL